MGIIYLRYREKGDGPKMDYKQVFPGFIRAQKEGFWDMEVSKMGT